MTAISSSACPLEFREGSNQSRLDQLVRLFEDSCAEDDTNEAARASLWSEFEINI